MQDTLTYKSLIRLSLLKVKRSKAKNALNGLIAEVITTWIPIIIIFICLKREGLEMPILASYIVCFGAVFIDFIAKLIFVPDNTVMDAFLKTRPISKKMWNRFMAMSQFWKISNLRMPSMALLFCLLFMPIGIGICTLVVLYLLSVLGGFLVMLIKRRGTYQSETMVDVGRIRDTHSFQRNNIFKLQTRSFFRSKRLKRMNLFIGILICLNSFYVITIQPSFTTLFVFFIILLLPFSIVNYGFGFESNFFNAIWTKPFAIRRLLNDKYWFNTILRAIGSIFCLPLCLFTDLHVLSIVAYFLFIAGWGGLIQLYDPYKCVPFDLFGKTFNNNQGSSTGRKPSILLSLFGIIGMGFAISHFLPILVSQILLSALGILGFCLHKQYFKWVENKFLKDKYKYMDKYTSI